MTTESAPLKDEERYRLLIDSITDYAIYMLDDSGIVTSWNPGARRFKGYEASEILGQHFSRFYTDEDRKAGAPGTRADGSHEKPGASKVKAGVSGKTDLVFGPASPLIRSSALTASCSATPRSPAT